MCTIHLEPTPDLLTQSCRQEKPKPKNNQNPAQTPPQKIPQMGPPKIVGKFFMVSEITRFVAAKIIKKKFIHTYMYFLVL